MERKSTKLISDVSDIKEKQDSLQLSLSVLNHSRAAGMEHQRGLPSTVQGLQQPCEDPTSFCGPFVTPSTSSSPMVRKPTAWYMTDSFAEQFSPTGSRCAQSSFEIGYQLPAVHVPPQEQQRKALGQSPVPKLPGKRLPLSDLPLPPPPQQQRDTETPAMDGPKDGEIKFKFVPGYVPNEPN